MFDDLKIRYKESKLPVRLGLCAFVAMIPAAFLYVEDSSAVDEEYKNAENLEKAAAQKLLAAENTLKNMPKKEAELAFTREQLKKAESRLPDNVAVDEILRTVAKSSKTYGVNITLFEPQAEILRGDNYKFLELPFKISVEANDYSQICEWLDNVIGSKSKIYLRSWKLSRNAGSISDIEGAGILAGPTIGQSLTTSQLAEQDGRKARERLRLLLETDVSVFKMASAAQMASAQSATGQMRPDGSPAKTQPGDPKLVKPPGDGAVPSPKPASEGSF